MRVIQKAEILFSIAIGRGRFADLPMLGREGFIGPQLATAEMYDYKFQIQLLGTSPPMFDVIATPQPQDESCPAKHSFYSNETLILYQADAQNPPRATANNRVPTSGMPVEDAPPGAPCLE